MSVIRVWNMPWLTEIHNVLNRLNMPGNKIPNYNYKYNSNNMSGSFEIPTNITTSQSKILCIRWQGN